MAGNLTATAFSAVGAHQLLIALRAVDAKLAAAGAPEDKNPRVSLLHAIDLAERAPDGVVGAEDVERSIQAAIDSIDRLLQQAVDERDLSREFKYTELRRSFDYVAERVRRYC